MPSGDRKLRMEELDRPAPAVNFAAPKRPLIVLLEDVRSRHNVGSIFRTADAFGAERVILCGYTPKPPHREIEKTALGATDSVPWEHAPNARTAVQNLQNQGYTVWSVEQTLNAISLNEIKSATTPTAVVFGNELNGVSDEVIQVCDGSIVIPQHGSKHSLNVSVCAGIVLWWMSSLH